MLVSDDDILAEVTKLFEKLKLDDMLKTNMRSFSIEKSGF